MTTTARTISTDADLLGVLFALTCSGYWLEKDVSRWATRVLMQSESPASWLMDFVVVESSGTMENVFHRALLDAQILLPQWAYNLSAGFVMMRHDNGDLSEEQARNLIADLTDPNPICGITIEEVYDLSLADCRLLGLRDEAEELLDQVERNPVLPAILALVSR